MALLEQALNRLQAEGGEKARDGSFAELKPFVTGEQGPLSYAATAARLGLSLSAVKSAIFRLRRRYHELVREEVAHTVAEPQEVEEELRHMLAIFSRGG